MWPRSHPTQRGAALVEFAILAPLLVILILGIVEFGYKFGQFNDVRHAAREAARFAAVDAGTTSDVENVVCSALEGVNADITSVTIRLDNDTADTTDSAADGEKGDPGLVAVIVDVSSLTNLPIISTFLPTQLTSEIPFRLERDTNWTPRNAGASPWTATSC